MTENPFRGRIALGCESPERAEALAKALEPDNETYANCRVDGATVRCDVRGDDIGSLLRAADDLLACAQVALGVAKRVDAEP